MKGVIINKDKRGATFLKDIFYDHFEKQYNWLIADYECYPSEKSTADRLNGEWCWLSGTEFSEIVEEDFQWIWGCIFAFPQNISLEEVLAYELPTADGNSKMWKKPLSMQHPLSEIEVIAWDSTFTVAIDRKGVFVERLIHEKTNAEGIEKYLIP